MLRLPRSWPDLRLPRWGLAVAAVSGAWSVAAHAQDRSYVEATSDAQRLSAGYAPQYGAGLRAVIDRRQRSVWIFDVTARRAFMDDGIGVAAMNVTEIGSAPWIVSLGASTSAGGFFLPRVRADASIGRKWLAQGNVVTTLLGRFIEAKDGHRDRAVGGEVTLYGSTAIVQLGSTLNFSSPGNVMSPLYKAAVTLGSPDRESLVLQGGFGREAYQPLTVNSSIVDFPSASFGATWRRWTAGGWGVAAGIETYGNSTYDRMGASIGVMRRLGARGVR